MQVGIFAKTFAGVEPGVVLAASAAAGFDGVAYNLACSGLAAMPEVIVPGVAEAVAAAARVTGQAVFSLSGTWNMIHPDPVVRAAGLRRLAVLAGACRAMGTGLITLCTGTRDAADQWRHHADNGSAAAWADLLVSFEGAVLVAEAHGVMLGVEPELANVVSSAAAARRLLDEMRSDRIGIVLDPANLVEVASGAERRRVIEDAVDMLGGHIVMAHAKDRAAEGGFATAGRGVIDFDHFLRVLRGVGFDGPLVAHGLAADEAAGVAVFLRERLAGVAA